MDYDRIILEMLDRIKSLEDEVATLKNNSENSNDGNEPIKSSKKYRRLTELLTNAEGKPVSISFGDIEKTIGFRFLIQQENTELFGQIPLRILSHLVG